MQLPNVIHISWHDIGRYFGCYGRGGIGSANVDRLAGEGVKFENVWATSPVCSPSRASCMTGRYPQSIGVMGLAHGPQNYGLYEGEKHVSLTLREAGYATALVGWQHEVPHGRVRTQLGFDEIYHNDPMPECQVHVPVSVQWIKKKAGAGRPFYLQTGFSECHRPHRGEGVVADKLDDVYVPGYLVDNQASRRELAMQQGMIRKADAYVGMILDAVKQAGVEENTLVVFTSDHGVEMPRSKWHLYDPGLEIPLVMRWPGRGIDGGKSCDWMLSNVDFYPTLMELLGLTCGDNVQGQSFAGAMVKGLNGDGGRQEIYAMFLDECRAVRTRNHKLIWNVGPRQEWSVPVDMGAVKRPARWPLWELYDLQADPNEFVNLSGEQAVEHEREATEQAKGAGELEKSLKQKLFSWMEAIGDPILRGPEVKPYYAQAMQRYWKK